MIDVKQTVNERAESSRTALTVMLGAVFMVLADVFIATIATPAIRADLAADTLHIQLALALYNVSYGALLLGGARLGDRFGNRRMFLAGCVFFGLASAVCAGAPSAEVLVIGRLLQGIGPALLMPQVFTFIQVHLAESARLHAFAAFSAVSGIAAAGSQVIGGILIDLDLFGLGWRTVFWINIPVMIAIVLLGIAKLPQSGGSRRAEIDGAGLAAVTIVLLATTSALSFAQHLPGIALVAVCLSVVGVVLARAAFRRARRQGRDTIIDTGVFQLPGFRGLLVSSLAYYAGNAILFSLLPVYLIGARGYSAATAGLFFVALAGTFAVVSATLPRLVQAQPHLLLTVGSTALVLNYLLLALALLLTRQLSAVVLVALLVLIGCTMGCIAPALNALAVRLVPAASASSASGLVTTALEVGYGLGAAIGIGSYAIAQTRAAEPGHALAASLGIATLLTIGLAMLVARSTVSTASTPW